MQYLRLLRSNDEITNSLILISIDTAFFISSATIIAEIVSFDLYYMFAFLAVFFRSSKAPSKLPFCKVKHLEREDSDHLL